MENRSPVPIEFALSQEEGGMEPFISGAPLTRANFMDFYIQSHDGSYGSFGAQVIKLEWYAINQGVDYMGLIRQCCEAGGWAALTESERQVFMDAFNAVSAHQSKRHSERLFDGAIFNDNIQRILTERMTTFRNALQTELHGMTYEEMEQRRRTQIERYHDFVASREDFL